MFQLPELQISTLLENRVWIKPVVPLSKRMSPPGKRMEKTLKSLLQGVEVTSLKGAVDIPVRAVITDSRRVAPGCLFVAREGLRTDGRLFVEEAIDRGAVAVLSTGRAGIHRGVTFVEVASVDRALAQVAGNFYSWPDQRMDLVGVTGTNGKTTVTWMVHRILRAMSVKAGLVGTICYDLGERTVPSFKTTPEAVDIFSMLAQMQKSGCGAAALEVSSHGIAQHRVAGMRFRVGVFTNLTQDHLDYHQDMEEYYRVKRRLFTGETGHLPEVAVVNVDDPYGRRLLNEIPGDVRIVTYGLSDDAMVRAVDPVFDRQGTRFSVHTGSGSIAVETGLAGRFNLSNSLAALAVARELDLDLARVAGCLKAFSGVPGRLERIEEGQSFGVYVDYAHTDDALRHVLQTLREITPGKLRIVFGCGGNRDRGKRPLMMHVAQTFADEIWATTDNPRGEAIQDIFEDMRRGVSHPERTHFVEDRREAIYEALAASGDDDVVLIAGKGHEPYLEYADTVVPFDDRLVARELLGKIGHSQKSARGKS